MPGPQWVLDNHAGVSPANLPSDPHNTLQQAANASPSTGSGCWSTVWGGSPGKLRLGWGEGREPLPCGSQSPARKSLGTTTYLRVPLGTILWSSPCIWPARGRLLCSPRVDYYPLRANGDWQDWARRTGSWSSVHIRAAHRRWALRPA